MRIRISRNKNLWVQKIQKGILRTGRHADNIPRTF